MVRSFFLMSFMFGLSACAPGARDAGTSFGSMSGDGDSMTGSGEGEGESEGASQTGSDSVGEDDSTNGDSTDGSDSGSSGSGSDSDDGPGPNCGDAVVDPGEQCDDGNDDSSDACAECALAYCGDGFVQAGVEECDDGNDVSTDDCLPVFCTAASCGDGYLHENVEQCDDGNLEDTDACPSTCEPGYCGDGFKWEGMEDCDDGNNVSNDGCTDVCALECDGMVITDDFGGFTYYRVAVMGAMTDANVKAACDDCGLLTPCTGLQGCTYNGNGCTQTNNENSCGNPMMGLSTALCGTNPAQCADLWGVFQWMGGNWVNGSSCGALQNQWCVQGSNYQNGDALCVN